MIKSIALKNWKTHKDTKIEFSKGANILIGQMGAGKSSVMDAISFALFGSFPAMQHKKVNVSKLIRNKPKQESNSSLTLTLELNGDEYVIVRELSIDGKSSATINKNGSYLQSQPKRVTEEIERILKVDYDMFSKAIYSEQNGLDYFLNISSSERKKQIDSLLGIDKFAIAQDNATTLVNRLRDMVVESERIAKDFDVEKSKSALYSLKSERDSFKKEYVSAEAAIKLHETEKQRIESEIIKYNEQNKRKAELSNEIEAMKGRLGLLESESASCELQSLPEKEAALSEKKAMSEKLASLKAEDSRNSERERSLHSELSRLEVEFSNSKKDIIEKNRLSSELSKQSKERLQKQLNDSSNLLERLSQELAMLKSSIEEAHNQVDGLKGHVTKCPICERELDESSVSRILASKEGIIRDHTLKLHETEASISREKELSSKLNLQINSMSLLEDKLKTYSDIEARNASIESKLSKAQEDYKNAKALKDASSKSLLDVTEKLQNLNAVIGALERKLRYEAEISTLKSLLSEKTALFGSIDISQATIDSLQLALVKTNSEISKNSANMASITRYLKEKELQISEKESDIARIEKILNGISRKRSLVDNISKFKRALSETQTVLRGQLISSINSIMGEVWTELYPYGDYPSIIIDASEDDYSLMLKVLSNNEYAWEDVNSIASGGERSIACLAMRIAMSLVLVPNLKWIILDEPTHNIDSEGLSKFVRMFSDTLPGLVDQIFIITHDDMLKQVSNANIFLLSRDKEGNQETGIAIL